MAVLPQMMKAGSVEHSLYNINENLQAICDNLEALNETLVEVVNALGSIAISTSA